MITEYDLAEAIAECEGQRNPSISTCMKLASLYIIKDKKFPEEKEMTHVSEIPMMSFSNGDEKMDDKIRYEKNNTEFSKENLFNWKTILELYPLKIKEFSGGRISIVLFFILLTEFTSFENNLLNNSI